MKNTKIRKTIRDEMVDNLKKWAVDTHEDILKDISLIENADSVEQIMKVKQKLLSDLISALPMGEKYCYFCLVLDLCKNCPYGKVHGICKGFGFLSDWAKINHARKKLLMLVDKLYYKGEKYDAR